MAYRLTRKRRRRDEDGNLRHYGEEEEESFDANLRKTCLSQSRKNLRIRLTIFNNVKNCFKRLRKAMDKCVTQMQEQSPSLYTKHWTRIVHYYQILDTLMGHYPHSPLNVATMYPTRADNKSYVSLDIVRNVSGLFIILSGAKVWSSEANDIFTEFQRIVHTYYDH